MYTDFFGEEWPDDLAFTQFVCVGHMRHAPCRPCMRDGRGVHHWSNDPDDIETVRKYHAKVADP